MHSSNQSASNQTVDQCVSSLFGQRHENMDTELIAATNTCIVPNLFIVSIEVRAKLTTPNITTSSATDRDKLLKTMLRVGMQHKLCKTAIFGPGWSPAQGKTGNDQPRCCLQLFVYVAGGQITRNRASAAKLMIP